MPVLMTEAESFSEATFLDYFLLIVVYCSYHLCLIIRQRKKMLVSVTDNA